jgi:potassium-transporting ATPase potassium-binding subunit
MSAIGWVQVVLYCAIIVAIVPLLGAYMTQVFSGERTFLSPILRPVEIAIYKIAGVDERSEQHAVTYTVSMLLFHVGGFSFLMRRCACRRDCRSIEPSNPPLPRISRSTRR